MRSKKYRHVEHVRVIRDTRDSMSDYWISVVDAEQAYKAGRLGKLTNTSYIVI